jgi:hypothetical protein
MKKKQSPKKRQKPKARRHQKARAKSRPRLITGVDLTEDRAGSDKSTQSGDTQGLSDDPGATFESVKELTEEGQYLEAEIVEGVEDARDADAGPVKTREVPEDDVPDEYRTGDSRERQS